MAATTATGAAGVGPAEDGLCVLGADACAAAALAAIPGDVGRAVDDQDATYATPAEIDCRPMIQPDAPIRLNVRLLLSGDCEPTVPDLRYRVSRSADSERSSGAFRSDRARRSVRAAPVATGVPTDAGLPLTASVQPMALYASHDLIPPIAGTTVPEAGTLVATRALDPPDRPPRI
jgi:hypothetical protein